MPPKTKHAYKDIFYINFDDGTDDVYICGLTKNVNKITIPGNINGHKVRSIGNNAFQWSVFSEVTIENGVSEIEDGAFAFNNKLLKIAIPSSVTKIGNNAFVKQNLKLTIVCDAGSYAARWGREHGIKVSIIKKQTSNLSTFLEQYS